MAKEDKKAIIKSELYGFFKKVGDVVYWDGNELKTCSYAMYNSEMGTAVGVIVIPSNFLPDGKARMVSLHQTNSTQKTWSNSLTDTSLINHTNIPITDNTGFTSSATTDNYGNFPNDISTGTTSFVNPTMKYIPNSADLIPCPYFADGSMNPEYMKNIDGNNPLSDFNGKANTDLLVGLGTSYSAANEAASYSISGIDIDWYLPACGEVGIMATKIGQINAVISNLGGVTVPLKNLWSSTERNTNEAYYLSMKNASVSYLYKNNASCYARSFALV